jgi:hypothetical protein
MDVIDLVPKRRSCSNNPASAFAEDWLLVAVPKSPNCLWGQLHYLGDLSYFTILARNVLFAAFD